jgi:Ser-tRNA(Ala) deacylase AlaX
MFKTSKLYYVDPYATSCSTAWRMVNSKTMAIARSVAFPEGGGQLGDWGVVEQGEKILRFVDCQSRIGLGRTIIRDDFPVINVEGEVHLIFDEDITDVFSSDFPVKVTIDIDRRIRLSQSHSASHLLYLAMTRLRPDVPTATVGCQIRPEGGRFDVAVEKFSPEDLVTLSEIVQELRSLSPRIEIASLPGEPECRIWQLDNTKIPCGGTHVEHLMDIPIMHLRRVNKGKGLERIEYRLDPTDAPVLREKFFPSKSANTGSSL